MSFDQEKPKFGAHNPALDLDHDDGKKELFSWVVGIILAVLGLYWLTGGLTNILARKISDEQEARWFSGKTAIGLTGFAVESGATVSDFKRCQDLLSKMKSRKGLRRLPYDLYYSPNKIPNAFAAPGGSLLVTQGLLDLVKSDMGLAMVLGHELGHHQHRDPLRGMGRNLLTSVTLGIFLGGDAGAARFVAGLIESSYSREQELRADRFGFELVRSTFNRTAGALEFFEKISEHQNSKIHQLTSMLSTHPFTPDRISALQKLEADMLDTDKSELK